MSEKMWKINIQVKISVQNVIFYMDGREKGRFSSSFSTLCVEKPICCIFALVSLMKKDLNSTFLT